MPMKIDQVSNLIEMNKAPYWKLFLISGISKDLVFNYQCENVPEGSSDETRIRASKEALQNAVFQFSGYANPVFAIQMRKLKTSNGDGVFGFIQFSVDGPGNSQVKSGDGLGSIEGMKTQHQKDLDILRAEMILEFNKMELERDKKDFEKRKQSALGEIEAERKKVEKKSAPIVMAFERFFPVILASLTGMNTGAAQATTEAMQTLAGGKEDEPDEREDLCNEIAETLYNSGADETILLETLSKLRNGHRNKETEETGENGE